MYFTRSLFLILCSLAAGIFNIRLRKKHPLPANGRWIANAMVFDCVLALSLWLMLTALYSLSAHADFLIPLASSVAFLLPSVIRQAWIQYLAIPAKSYPVWYGREIQVSQGVKVLGEQIHITLLLSLPHMSMPREIPVRLPANQSLGKAFLSFQIANQRPGPEAIIELFDKDQQPYGWQFYLIQLNGFRKKYLDPKMSLSQLSIKEKSVIEVHRKNSRPPVSYRMKLQ